MRNFPKAGLLIVTLVIPALIFVFLNFFARNHYDLPYFNPEVDGQGRVVIANGDTLFRKMTSSCPELEKANIEGRLTVISSLQGDCDDDCRIVLAQLSRINSLKIEIPELDILTLTRVSNQTDANLPKEIGSKGWSLLKVSDGTIDSCFNRISLTRKGLDSDISSRLILVDKKGYVRGYYNGSDASETDRLMAEIKILDYEGETSEE